MFSLGDELCGGFFYEVAFFNLVLSVPGCAWKGSAPSRHLVATSVMWREVASADDGSPQGPRCIEAR